MPVTWRARGEALKVLRADQVLVADLLAGPLIQSREILATPVVELKLTLKLPDSYEAETARLKLPE